VRLHPRPGNAEVTESHIGGPMLASGDLAWPTCGEHVGVSQATGDEVPLPLVGAGQFYMHDFPEIDFPADKDLLQVYWCPSDHEIEYESGYPYSGPGVRLRWLASAAGEGREVARPGPVRHGHTEESYLVHPCVLDPERVVEYPDIETLGTSLATQVEGYERSGALGFDCHQLIAPGWKIGGWEKWHLTGYQHLACPECGSEVRLLLKAEGTEWDAASDRWWPVEERDVDVHERQGLRAPTGATFGRAGELRVFTCVNDAHHRPVLNIQ
jgi:hypothetical protein